MKRAIIGFVLPSPFYNRKSEFGFRGEFNGYVAVPNERVREEWIAEDDMGFRNEPPSACGEITLNVEGDWAIKNRRLYKNVVGNIEDVDDTYQIFGWDYAHIWNTPENSSYERVVDDVKKQVEFFEKKSL